MQFNIISKKLIKPSSPTPDHLRFYKRSFFEQLAAQCYVPCVLFYPHDPSHGNLTDNVVANRNRQLEESLSKVLSYFPPIAGRFGDDSSIVDCSDQGIPYVTAKADCQLSEFLDKFYEDLDVALALGSQVMEEYVKLYTSPLASVQVTFFECGGFALFVSTCHAVMDGFTSMTFTHTWAEMSCSGNPRGRPISFDNGNIFPARDMSATLKQSQFLKKDKEKFAGKRFIFDEAVISELIDKTKATSGDDIGFQPSRVEVVTSFLWRALIRAMQEKRGGDSRPFMMLLPINLRQKIGGLASPLANSFGTLVICVPMKVRPNNNNMELHDFIKLMRETKEKTIEACAKADSDELFSMMLSFRNEVIEWEDNADRVDLCLITGLCNFPLYESDFGWGRPCSAHFGYRNYPVFWLYGSKRGKGIVAQVDLTESVMCKFQEDPELIAYLRSPLASE